jgi:hypothetical protein
MLMKTRLLSKTSSRFITFILGCAHQFLHLQIVILAHNFHLTNLAWMFVVVKPNLVPPMHLLIILVLL